MQVFTFHSGRRCVIAIVSFCAAHRRYVWRGLGQDLVGEVSGEADACLNKKVITHAVAYQFTGYSDLNEGIYPHLQEVGHIALSLGFFVALKD